MADTPTFVPLTLTTLKADNPIVSPGDGKPTPSFVQNINNSFKNILVAVNGIGNTQAQIDAVVQEQADLLNQFIALEGLVVDNSGQLVNASIPNSVTDPTSVLTATTTGTAPTQTSTIVVANHVRVYTDGTQVNVTGTTITGLNADTAYWVYYSDPNRHGGVETYLHSTNSSDAAQVGGIHSVGSILTPDTTTATNDGTDNNGNVIPPRPTCVDVESIMPTGYRAGDLISGSPLFLLNEDDLGWHLGSVKSMFTALADCYRVTTESGITLIASESTPMTTRNNKTVNIKKSQGIEVAVLDNGDFRWEYIVDVAPVGVRKVAHIDAWNNTYAAGETVGRFIFSHNIQNKQIQ